MNFAVKPSRVLQMIPSPETLRRTLHLNTLDLAQRWRMSEKTLRNWRWSGHGPIAIKLGSRVVYRLADIESYEAERAQASTAEC